MLLSRALFTQRSRLTRGALIRRNLAGGGGGGNSNSAYGRMMSKYPVLTSIATAMALWGGGDLISQGLEIMEDPTKNKFQFNRFAGVLTHGTVMGGVGNYYWYNFLDSLVRNRLQLAAGARFVAAKIGLEIAIWHPTGLFAYWVIVGLWEGNTWPKIQRELKKDFFPTLTGDVCLWTPMDILNFTKVPVSMQTLFINVGSLFEAVALSYIHKHGFGKDEHGHHAGGHDGADSDKIQETKSHVAKMYSRHLPIIDRMLHMERSLSPEQLSANIKLQFSQLDADKNGYLTLKELKRGGGGGCLLPGIDDEAVSDKVTEIIHRLGDEDGDGRISEQEYERLLLKFHQVGYRKSFIADVVLAIFDANGDGFIDTKEMKSILRVLGCDSSDKAVKEAMEACDVDGDGKVSAAELVVVLKSMHIDT